MTILQFMSDSPILTVVIIFVILGFTVDIIKALKGKKDSDDE